MLPAAEFDAALAALFAGEPTCGVSSAYLFGSRAEERAHRESDIDLAVLLDRDRYPDEQNRFDARLRLIGDIGAVLQSNRLDLVVLNDAPASLSRAILSRGRRVFCNDHEADHTFVRTTLLLAADLEPWLRRMRHLKLDAIRR